MFHNQLYFALWLIIFGFPICFLLKKDFLLWLLFESLNTWLILVSSTLTTFQVIDYEYHSSHWLCLLPYTWVIDYDSYLSHWPLLLIELFTMSKTPDIYYEHWLWILIKYLTIDNSKLLLTTTTIECVPEQKVLLINRKSIYEERYHFLNRIICDHEENFNYVSHSG